MWSMEIMLWQQYEYYYYIKRARFMKKLQVLFEYGYEEFESLRNVE